MNAVLHETATRLRLQAPAQADLDALAARLRALEGVQGVRANRRVGCVTVHVDGRPATRQAVLRVLDGHCPAEAAPEPAAPDAAARRAARHTPEPQRRAVASELDRAAGLLAAALPFVPAAWRAGGALGVVAARLLSQRARLKRDAPAVLLDAAAQASLAVNGQPLVVSASVLMRLLTEGLSQRVVRETDRLLGHLLPEPAGEYRVLRGPDEPEHWWPLRRVRAGDRLRLYAGDVVPVDGCVADGRASLHPVAQAAAPREVAAGTHVAAGERVLHGTFELRAESDAAGSRLERLRAQLRHAMGARDPVGRLTPDFERLVSLPLTGAALVLGLTGDRARAATMLQADPQRGLELALPVARESALLALARQGLVTTGLESIERLARARTLVLQDTGVIAAGRWRLHAVATVPGGDAEHVRAWLAALAGVPAQALAEGGLPDLLVRQWVRHGALVRDAAHELHLAAPRRLQALWGIDIETLTVEETGRAAALERHFGLVAQGRLVARVALRSESRDGAAAQLASLRQLGFERIAVFVEDDGSADDPGGAARHEPPLEPQHVMRGVLQRLLGASDASHASHASGTSEASGTHHLREIEALAGDALTRSDWLAEATQAGEPIVLLHTVLRDLVPPGSLSLTTVDAEAGAHGVLLGDPLTDLVRARQLATEVHHRLRLHQGAAAGANALLMTASALRWLPPMGTTLLNHGFALLVLLDSLRIEALGARQAPSTPPPAPTPATPGSPRSARTPRSASPPPAPTRRRERAPGAAAPRARAKKSRSIAA